MNYTERYGWNKKEEPIEEERILPLVEEKEKEPPKKRGPKPKKAGDK